MRVLVRVRRRVVEIRGGAGLGEALAAAGLQRHPPGSVSKLLLLSIVIATVAIPARAALGKNPRAGLKKALVQMAIFNAFYLFGLLYLYGRL